MIGEDVFCSDKKFNATTLVFTKMLSFQVVSILVALFLSVLWYRRRHLYEFSAKLPGYTGLPLIGSLYQFIGLTLKEQYALGLKNSQRFANTNYKVWLGPYLFFLVRDPNDVKIILNSAETFEKTQIIYGLYFKFGLLVMGGEQYKLHRKAITPLFQPETLKTYMPTINRKMDSFMERFDKRLEPGAFDFTLLIMDFFLDSLLATMFGIDHIDEEVRMEFIEDTERNLRVQNQKFWSVWHSVKTKFSNNFKALSEFESTNVFLKLLFGSYETDYQQKLQVEDKKSSPFLNQIYKIRDTITFDQLKEEVSTFLDAGFDTSGTTISKILLLLAMNQEEQEKVLQEVSSVIRSGEEINDEAIAQLEYLDLVIKESLRFFPVSFGMSREVSQDLKLTNYTVPKGVCIILPQIEQHTDKNYWGDDVGEFKPERFLSENFEKVHPYVYIPFSRGPRMCPGYRYATMAMKIFLSKFLLKYRVTTPLTMQDISDCQLAIATRTGFSIKVERR